MSAYNPDIAAPGRGLLDLSGGIVVHALGGMAALIGVAVLGPRQGRFSPDGHPVELQGAVVRALRLLTTCYQRHHICRCCVPG